jgi:phosphoribosylglycinamide formyltransferase-1
VKVRSDDSENTLSARVQQQEHRIYSQAIDWFARGRLQLREQRAWLDGRPLDAPLVELARD